MRYFWVAMQWLGFISMAHGLMLLGADEITTIERGGIRTSRSLERILMLYGIDPLPWIEATLPGGVAGAIEWLFSAPAWLILFVGGGALTLLTRKHV